MSSHAGIEAAGRAVRSTPGGREVAGFVGEPPMFVVVHEANDARRATLICSPLYAEFMQNYGREVRLARRLAESGIAAGRFHYLGSGDSSGSAVHLTLDSMVHDAFRVVDQLRDETGTETVDVVGTRLAGHVAAAVASQVPDARLVLWEPVPDVSRYFDEVFRTRRMVGVIAGDEGASSAAAMREELMATGRLDVVGYHIHKALFESALDAEFPTSGLGDVLMVQASRSEKIKAGIQRLADTVTGAGGRATVAIVPPGDGWWIHNYDEHASPVQSRQAEKQLLDLTADWLQRS